VASTKTQKAKRQEEEAVRLEKLKELFRPGDFMGVAEVNAALGVSPGNLQFIRDLPEPVDQFRATRVWYADEIQDFAKIWNAKRSARAHARTT
jgi:hypothetical protein